MAARDARGGFTLLELVIAMAILAMIAGSVAAGIRLAAGSIERGEAATRDAAFVQALAGSLGLLLSINRHVLKLALLHDFRQRTHAAPQRERKANFPSSVKRRDMRGRPFGSSTYAHDLKLFEDWKASGLSEKGFIRERGLKYAEAHASIERGRKNAKNAKSASERNRA